MRPLSVLTLVALLSAPSFAHAQQNAKLFVTSPLPIVLGEVEKISLVIEAPETPETIGRPLQVSVNVGRIDPPERVGIGKYRAHYYLPATKFPQAAIVAVWRETGPDAEVDFLRIPLSARTKLPFKTKAGADVRVFIGDDKFGPVSADRKGQATIPIVVPPGVKEVEVESIAGLDRQRSSVVVKVPPYNRLGMAVTPYLLTGEPQYATAHLYYDDQRPPVASKVKLNVSGGEAKFVAARGNRFTYRITPSKSAGKEIKLSATIDGDAQANAQSTILVGAPVAERVLSRTSSTTLAADGVATKVIRVLVVDHYGLGVGGLPVSAATSAGKIDKPRDAGSGYYECVLTAPDSMPKNKRARVTFSASAAAGQAITADIDTPLIGGANIGAVGEVTEVETPVGPSKPAETPLLAIGAAIGGTYDAQIAPMGMIEVSLHPKALERRLGIFLAVSFRSMSREFGIDGFPGLKSSVTRLPVVAGVTYDFVARGSGRGYIGAAGGVAGVAHRVEADFQDPIVYRRIVPTAQAIVGGQYAGIFLEASAIYMPVSDDALTLPAVGYSLSLGYRLGLF